MSIFFKNWEANFQDGVKEQVIRPMFLTEHTLSTKHSTFFNQSTFWRVQCVRFIFLRKCQSKFFFWGLVEKKKIKKLLLRKWDTSFLFIWIHSRNFCVGIALWSSFEPCFEHSTLNFLIEIGVWCIYCWMQMRQFSQIQNDSEQRL